MDYKDIEELLNKYQAGETSLDEEVQLRLFFTTEEVPPHLQADRDLFLYQCMQQKVKIGSDFDERILSAIDVPVVKARNITLISRFIPLLKAVAIVAVVFSFGAVLQYSFFADKEMNTYSDTYDDPAIAYKEVSTVLMMLSEEINKSKVLQLADSLKREEITKPLER